jgi:hypothetical protein
MTSRRRPIEDDPPYRSKTVVTAVDDAGPRIGLNWERGAVTPGIGREMKPGPRMIGMCDLGASAGKCRDVRWC